MWVLTIGGWLSLGGSIYNICLAIDISFKVKMLKMCIVKIIQSIYDEELKFSVFAMPRTNARTDLNLLKVNAVIFKKQYCRPVITLSEISYPNMFNKKLSINDQFVPFHSFCTINFIPKYSCWHLVPWICLHVTNALIRRFF